jgi:hypothetical protein
LDEDAEKREHYLRRTKRDRLVRISAYAADTLIEKAVI